MTRPISGLFLHGGPGSSAIPEFEKFGDSLGIDWWTQPRPTNVSKAPFEDLIEACEARLVLRASTAGGQVKIYANSLGAVTALELASRRPNQISAITLLGPVPDAPDCYVRLARQLAKKSTRQESLLANAEALERWPGEPEKLWALIGAINASSEFLELYWSPSAKAQSEWFASLFSDPAVFDGQAFQTLMDDLLARKEGQRPVQFFGPVTMFIGVHDPLVDVDQECSWWKAYFPQVDIRIVEAGHFPHLEMPSGQWV